MQLYRVYAIKLLVSLYLTDFVSPIVSKTPQCLQFKIPHPVQRNAGMRFPS